MANEFAIGMEQSFLASWGVIGYLIAAKATPSVSIKAILDGIEMTSAVRPEGGRQAELSGTITILTADWISNGLKKGSRIILPDTRECRIELESFVEPSGRGTVNFRVTQI